MQHLTDTYNEDQFKIFMDIDNLFRNLNKDMILNVTKNNVKISRLLINFSIKKYKYFKILLDDDIELNDIFDNIKCICFNNNELISIDNFLISINPNRLNNIIPNNMENIAIDISNKINILDIAPPYVNKIIINDGDRILNNIKCNELSLTNVNKLKITNCCINKIYTGDSELLYNDNFNYLTKLHIGSDNLQIKKLKYVNFENLEYLEFYYHSGHHTFDEFIQDTQYIFNEFRSLKNLTIWGLYAYHIKNDNFLSFKNLFFSIPNDYEFLYFDSPKIKNYELICKLLDIFINSDINIRFIKPNKSISSLIQKYGYDAIWKCHIYGYNVALDNINYKNFSKYCKLLSKY